MGHENTLNLPHASKSHHIINTNLNPPTEPSSHVKWSHSPIYVLTYYYSYRWLWRHPTDWGLGWRRRPHQTLSQKKKKADYIHSQRAIKEKATTQIKILWQPKEGKHSSYDIHHSTNPKPLEWASLNHESMFRSCYIILKHTYRLNVVHAVMHAGDTYQTTSTQTLLSPNALALSPIPTKLKFITR